MDTDDLEPRQKKPQLRNLEPLSIAELESYIAELKAEIVRTESAIAEKQAHRAAMDGLFKPR